MSDRIFDGHFVMRVFQAFHPVAQHVDPLRSNLRNTKWSADHGLLARRSCIECSDRAGASRNEPASGQETLKQRSRKMEADEIPAMLDSFDGIREEVARALGISETTLWRKLSGR
jgi:transcriptional regulator with PAS, ATPase and Fis domain